MLKFKGKNLYVFFAGILLVSYLLALIIITLIDQKEIHKFQNQENISYVESRVTTLDYFFNVLKKDILNISENKILSTYFINKALGMSLRYGLNANINKINRLLGEFILSERIHNNNIFKDIILIDSNKNIISKRDDLISIDLENLDLSKANRPIIHISKNQNDIYIIKNIFVKGKRVGTLVCFMDFKNIFRQLINEENHFILASKDKILTKSSFTLPSLLKDNNYIKIPIPNTPFILLGKRDYLTHETFLSKWIVVSLAFLAIPILYALYNFILLNNKNIKLEEEIKNSIKEKEKERIILQQSKVAAIGEMIGNIAHQWRQPLSVITTQATGTKLSLEFNKEISKKELIKIMDNINEQGQYLSKTIDDFRTFFKGSTNKISTFHIKNTLEKVKSLTKDTFKNNFIEYNTSIEDCKLIGNENILIQALINIYNNSKDAITSNPLEEKLFYIKTVKKDNQLLITIKDNGMGIEENILEKVFEPYFTTKHESIGTGIGLYMTNQIITKQFKGSIKVENETFFVKNKEYTGAKFTIKIPLSYS